MPGSKAASGGDARSEVDDRVPDSDAVLRRLYDSSPNWVYEDPETGERRPSSGAFAPKRDEDGVSVYREQLLAAAGLTAAAVTTSSGNLVVRLAVADVRAVPPLDVRNDLWPTGVPDPGHPRNGAHALIVGWGGLGRNRRRAAQVALVSAPSLRFVYP